MSIRIATNEDVTQIVQLVSSLSHYYLNDSSNELPSWLSETLKANAFFERISSTEYINFVFEQSGMIVGYISLKGGSYLYHLFVSEKFQGNGIACQFWQHAKENSQANSYSLRSSIFAVPVYKRFGFTEIGPVGTKDGISFQEMKLRCNEC